jgi:hypothetical protein
MNANLICKNRFTVLFFVFFFVFEYSFSQEQFPQLKRRFLPTLLFDQDRKFTNVGNIGLTVTNYGVTGHGFLYWTERQPSCEYPKGSRTEHLFLGGFWVGAQNRRTAQISVSTGAVDVGSLNRLNEGFEFTNEPDDSLTERSSLTGAFFDTNAISHQDFLCDYSDSRVRYSNGDTILNHIPLNVNVHQETYAWNYSFADFFVILNFNIYNAGADTLDSVYVGMWTNPAVRNTNLSGVPSGSEFYRHQGNGFVDSLRMHYTFDFDGQPYGPPADSYFGVKLLGAVPFPLFARHTTDSTFYQQVTNLQELDSSVHYNAWKFRNSSGDGAYFYPTDDDNADRYLSRYKRLKLSLPHDKISPLRLSGGNYTNLLSVGPYAQLLPGDSLNIVFAFICAKKFGTYHARFDSLESRTTFYANASWAQKAYDGEDINGNNILDAGEDLNNNGIIDRYVLPQPPRQPNVRVEVSNQNAVIYWDKETSENSIDPISKQKDFEGYRIYRSNAGADFLNPDDFVLTLSLVGEFDRNDDTIAYNTGFEKILLSQPKIFEGDTTQYWYRFPPKDAQDSGLSLLNGWQYLYGISAFDRGDAENNLPSLESGKVLARVIPGTPPTREKSKPVGVYPNPYYVNAYWDGTGERLRKLMFYNLPQRCTIRIYTLSGDVVSEIEHSEKNVGQSIPWYARFEGLQSDTTVYSGGEHAWDLVTKFNQALATGLYIFSVEDKSNGEIKTGKFLIIK